MNTTQSFDLTVITGDDTRTIPVTLVMMEDAASIFQSMDRDMSRGGKLGRHFIESPTVIQRCQIAGGRLLTALHTQNQASMTLMAAYILSRLPGVKTVNLNTEGEAEETMFYHQDNSLMS
jgi:hypothetical protein